MKRTYSPCLPAQLCSREFPVVCVFKAMKLSGLKIACGRKTRKFVMRLRSWNRQYYPQSGFGYC